MSELVLSFASEKNTCTKIFLLQKRGNCIILVYSRPRCKLFFYFIKRERQLTLFFFLIFFFKTHLMFNISFGGFSFKKIFSAWYPG